MALLKKAADEFILPTLETSSSDYAGLVAKRQELHELLSALNKEAGDLDSKIAAAPNAPHSGRSRGCLATQKMPHRTFENDDTRFRGQSRIARQPWA